MLCDKQCVMEHNKSVRGSNLVLSALCWRPTTCMPYVCFRVEEMPCHLTPQIRKLTLLAEYASGQSEAGSPVLGSRKTQ